jgi:hypothetical protein
MNHFRPPFLLYAMLLHQKNRLAKVLSCNIEVKPAENLAFTFG